MPTTRLFILPAGSCVPPMPGLGIFDTLCGGGVHGLVKFKPPDGDGLCTKLHVSLRPLLTHPTGRLATSSSASRIGDPGPLFLKVLTAIRSLAESSQARVSKLVCPKVTELVPGGPCLAPSYPRLPLPQSCAARDTDHMPHTLCLILPTQWQGSRVVTRPSVPGLRRDPRH